MNNTVLYRKYRPNLFKDVIGQDEIIDILTSSIKNHTESHAYLFTGPRGCGKTSVARLVAKAVNCLKFSEKGEICNECTNCLSINSGNSIDIIEMDAASNRGIEEIRNLKETVNFLPNQLRKKVYIIDEAHMLTKESFNALLKTLEEPPAHVMFILATTESHKVPVTILSRVMRFDFRFGSKENILTKLATIAQQESAEIDSDALEIIYTHSGGSFRDSESLLGKVLQKYSGTKLVKGDIIQILGIIDESEVDLIITELTNRNSDYILENFDRIFTNDSYLTTFTDQLISRINFQIEKNLKDIPKVKILVSLYQNIVEIKRNLREFSDKKSALKIELLRISSGVEQVNSGQPRLNPVATQAKSLQAATVTESQEKILPKVTQSVSNFESSTSEDLEIRSFVEKMTETISPSFPRIKGVLQTTKIEKDENVLIFRNATNYNLQQLSKPEVLEIITNISIEMFGDSIELKFELMSESEVVQRRSESRESETSSGPVNQTQSKPQPAVDNSDLVESIFLE